MESAEHVGQPPGLLHLTGLELQRWRTHLRPGLLEAVLVALRLGRAHAHVAATVSVDVHAQDVASGPQSDRGHSVSRSALLAERRSKSVQHESSIAQHQPIY